MGLVMEEIFRRAVENGSSSEGKPPKPLAGAYRKCFRAARVATVPCTSSQSVAYLMIFGGHLPIDMTTSTALETTILDVNGQTNEQDPDIPLDKSFVPILHSGGWADIGFRRNMEDTYICIDDVISKYGLKDCDKGPCAFYGVFDGHGGKHAADFACNNLPRTIAKDEDFPLDIERTIASAFLHTDTAFAEACFADSDLESGTTALAALVVGRLLVVANVGDCRAVLCRRGKAIEMSRDHKPTCNCERKRIEASGGFIDDGYLNGQLNVARALGDWHMEGMKAKNGMGPLSAEPEMMKLDLSEEDEFLIIACDGIWDVFRSQNAIDFVRRKLQEHNDPMTCCKELVEEALKRKSCDNLATIIVCFQSKPPPSLSVPRGRVHRSISAEGLKELQGFLDSMGN